MLRGFSPQPRVVLCDGDTVEARNLDRQLFTVDDIGVNKATALTQRLRREYWELATDTQWFSEATPLDVNPLLFACVDNHPARRAVLARADALHGSAIIVANDYTDASAEYYDYGWRGTALDPRVRWPEILTDQSNDPTRPQSCTGPVADTTPQLAMANMQSAALALGLFWFHFVEKYQKNYVSMEFQPHWPVIHRSGSASMSTQRVRDLAPTPST